ncbi:MULTISPECIES: aminotransferase class V-fold PLP-dependent enzyme [unclassified Streptomyces]|uniref:aminotransferase class V-fold PLP-dependent enzyme n=1 Tax=unclassified Streptomyces TaxID=2593676 RepID=UPI002252FDE6|nr:MULTISPECIES: aminotransferase class V-fold PLP-dependent enzyme [unclassified Streptomyces]MCX4991808.1 aminotransferase class V-fold PLP-dependent enzyme [Streptomyces sp. NBC_00568]MCX5002956.1 aminotransferase class V-fold PLP-dependent enzyme [Streptomyces sp. NBC_00638]
MDGDIFWAHSGPMETFETLVRTEFAPKNTYLNTASTGLLPARTVTAMRAAVESVAAGQPADMFADVEAARSSFARLVGVPERRVAAGASVAVYSGLIAASLPPGAEVLTAEADFSSVVTPFHVRGDLKVRAVPLERIAESVHSGTALVAVSAAQSADGRIAGLEAIREAAREHGARTYIDASQAAGWLPLSADAYDYVSSVAFKWLVCPRGVAFLVVPEDLGGLTPVFAGWVAGETPWDSCYGPVEELAHSARRFDESPSLFAYAGARHSLELLEELGVERVRDHNLALADRFRAGLLQRGHEPVTAPGSSIVSVPGLGGLQPELSRAGVEVSDRSGNLRAAFHLYNTPDDVDRLLDVLPG